MSDSNINKEHSNKNLNEASPQSPESQSIIKKWDELKLDSNILRGIYSHGFETPSPIQSKGILPILNGKDMIAQSQSGTGKTATFVIGALSRINFEEKHTQVLILVPTRELAIQINEVVTSLGMGIESLKSSVLVGGTSVEQSIRELRSDVPYIAVGTVGRMGDMIKRRALSIRNVKLLIIDEADEMMSYGFRDDVYEIISRLPEERQIVVFSATMSTDIVDRLGELMKDPVNIIVRKEALTLEGISQYYIALDNDNHKYLTLKDLYSSISLSHCIIYCNSVNRVRDLTNAMKEDGFPVCCIHSDMDKGMRQEAITGFRKGTNRVLISSDVTARGIDIQQVSLVINFDVCNSVHTYLHRIGRSGRWGRKGIGINFVTRRDVDKLRRIEQHYSTQINELPNNFMSSIV